MFATSVTGPAARYLRLLANALVLLCAIAGSACGQKGPLTLPAAPGAASEPRR